MALNWETPYPSQRSAVFARNMVATSQPLAAEAGIEILHAGGNAVDAAIATAITLTVVEPNNNGIGSDAFAIVWDGNQLHGLNASGKSPLALSPEQFKGRTTIPTLGWDAVTVPGAVSGWVALSKKFGRLPFAQLFNRAIHYAETGFQVGPKSGFYWKLAEKRFTNYESFCATFLPGGRAPAIGELIRLPDHGKSLDKIAASMGESFYQGELAEAMVKDARRFNGTLKQQDLTDHRCEWVEPIKQDFVLNRPDEGISNQLRQELVSLHEIPPNGQGLMALIALGILNHLNMGSYEIDSAESLHFQIEAMRIAYAEVERHLADINFMRVSVEALLDEDYLQQRAANIDSAQANPHPTTLGSGEDTVYLCTADESGMMVSMIQSNYRGFGSGIVVPNTGISLQNRGSGFTLEAGHPNQVAGGKRPFHTIIPGFVMQAGQASMAFGVMGGHMQAQGHVQMLLRIYVHNQNPQSASDAPRWHLREDGVVCLERGFSNEVLQGLKERGHTLDLRSPEHVFGGAQLIYRLDDGYCAGSDHRKEGLATGY